MKGAKRRQREGQAGEKRSSLFNATGIFAQRVAACRELMAGKSKGSDSGQLYQPFVTRTKNNVPRPFLATLAAEVTLGQKLRMR